MFDVLLVVMVLFFLNMVGSLVIFLSVVVGCVCLLMLKILGFLWDLSFMGVSFFLKWLVF